LTSYVHNAHWPVCAQCSCSLLCYLHVTRICCLIQGGHSAGKSGKVREFNLVGEKSGSRGKVMGGVILNMVNYHESTSDGMS